MMPIVIRGGEICSVKLPKCKGKIVQHSSGVCMTKHLWNDAIHMAATVFVHQLRTSLLYRCVMWGFVRCRIGCIRAWRFYTLDGGHCAVVTERVERFNVSRVEWNSLQIRIEQRRIASRYIGELGKRCGLRISPALTSSHVL